MSENKFISRPLLEKEGGEGEDYLGEDNAAAPQAQGCEDAWPKLEPVVKRNAGIFGGTALAFDEERDKIYYASDKEVFVYTSN